MLYALGRPVAFAALVVAFLLGLLLRAVAIRLTARILGLTDRRDPITPSPREDIDPFGAVAAAIGGVGWGKTISVDEVPRSRGRLRAAMVFLAGPLTCIVVAQLLFAFYVLAYTGDLLLYLSPSNVLLGIDLPAGQQILLSLAVGLLSFGLLALVPIPPLDGFGILYSALRRPGPSMQWMRLWFEEKNVGVVVLLVLSLFQFGSPYLLLLIDFLGVLFLRLWA